LLRFFVVDSLRNFDVALQRPETMKIAASDVPQVVQGGGGFVTKPLDCNRTLY